MKESLASTILGLLQKHDALAELPEIIDVLQKELYRSQAITVLVAEEPDKAQAEELKDLLTKKWGKHYIQITVDQSLLSGMIVSFGHHVIDLSGRASLKDLAASLT